MLVASYAMPLCPSVLAFIILGGLSLWLWNSLACQPNERILSYTSLRNPDSLSKTKPAIRKWISSGRHGGKHDREMQGEPHYKRS
jgi:hypothetical protein